MDKEELKRHIEDGNPEIAFWLVKDMLEELGVWEDFIDHYNIGKDKTLSITQSMWLEEQFEKLHCGSIV